MISKAPIVLIDGRENYSEFIRDHYHKYYLKQLTKWANSPCSHRENLTAQRACEKCWQVLLKEVGELNES